MLDQRVATLEADMREAKGSLARLEQKLDRMDARFDRFDAKLDARFETFDDRLRKLEIDVAEVKGRVISLPTTWAMITTSFGAVFATIGFLFGLLKVFGLP